jgi:phosphate-selective porin
MFFPVDDFLSLFGPDNVSCAAMTGSAIRSHVVMCLLAVVAVFAATPGAQADERWTTQDSAGILFVSDAGTETSWLHLPKVQLLAFRDDWYGTPQRVAQAQPGGEEAVDEPILLPAPRRPLYVPPQDGSPGVETSDDSGIAPPPPEPVETPATPEVGFGEPGVETSDDSGIAPPPPEPSIEEEVAAEEEEEEPVIPDLAKGILIASNHGDLTFKPGLRIQPRYMYDDGNDNNDFFIRRFRLKASGSIYDLGKYGLELKIDNEGRFAATPSARAENAWMDFPVHDELMYFRAGLYDLPFSRDALTSDSKLLFMDRTLIKEQLTAVGMADNTYGVMLHGRPFNAHLEYDFGIFDNDQFERFGVAGIRESDELMPAGRIAVALLDPFPAVDGYGDYMESYIGKGQRLEIGTNVAYLGDAIDTGVEQDLTAWGVDVFANSGPYTFQAEYDLINDSVEGGGEELSDGWYAQFGYLFHYDPCDPCAAEFCVRYEELDPFIFAAGVPTIGETLQWTRVGFNFYIREHNLKVQTDYCFRSGNDLVAPLPGGLGLFDEDVFEVQLQLDF